MTTRSKDVEPWPSLARPTRRTAAAGGGGILLFDDLLPPLELVYYLGDPDRQQVKIGNSVNLHRRLGTLRVRRPRLLVLATEPGSLALERKRHRQFKDLRQITPEGELEWFRKDPALMEHVAVLRQQHGILSSGRPLYRSWIAPLKGSREPTSVYVIEDGPRWGIAKTKARWERT